MRKLISELSSERPNKKEAFKILNRYAAKLKKVTPGDICKLWKYFPKDEDTQVKVMQTVEDKLVSDKGVRTMFVNAADDLVRLVLIMTYGVIDRHEMKRAISEGAVVESFQNKNMAKATVFSIFPELREAMTAGESVPNQLTYALLSTMIPDVDGLEKIKDHIDEHNKTL